MNKKIIGFVACAGFASIAAADQVSFQFQGLGDGRNVRISENGGNYFDVFSGSVIHNVDAMRTVTYCIDPDQWAQTGTMNFQQESLISALDHRSDHESKAWAIAELANAAGPSIWTEGVDRDLASAFQIAVWDIVLDFNPGGGASSLGLTSGNFRAMSTNGSPLSGGVLSYYDSLVGGLAFGHVATGGYTAYTNDAKQDFMSQIPTPGTGILALAGLPLIGSRRRR